MVKSLLVVASLFTLNRVAAMDLETEVDRSRVTAMAAFERGDPGAAVELNRRAIKLSQRLPESSWRTVENYDDAGLYYYSVSQWRSAAHHQAVAVLLSCGVAENAASFRAYVERLSWAFAKYRPQQDFGPIADNPLILLNDARLDIRSNFDVRRRFFQAYTVGGPRPDNPPQRRYKLKREKTTSCHEAPIRSPTNVNTENR